VDTDVFLPARIQFALTIMFHYLFPPLSIGLGTLMVFMEGMYLCRAVALLGAFQMAVQFFLGREVRLPSLRIVGYVFTSGELRIVGVRLLSLQIV
jgi:hypothetical protein